MEAWEYAFGGATVGSFFYGIYAGSKWYWRSRRREEKQADAAAKALVAVEDLCVFLKFVSGGVFKPWQRDLDVRWDPLHSIMVKFNDARNEVNTVIRNEAADRALMELNRMRNMLWDAQVRLQNHREMHNNETDRDLFEAAQGDAVHRELTAAQKAAEDILGPIARHEKPKRVSRFTGDDVAAAVGMVALVAGILYKEFG